MHNYLLKDHASKEYFVHYSNLRIYFLSNIHPKHIFKSNLKKKKIWKFPTFYSIQQAVEQIKKSSNHIGGNFVSLFKGEKAKQKIYFFCYDLLSLEFLYDTTLISLLGSLSYTSCAAGLILLRISRYSKLQCSQ